MRSQSRRRALSETERTDWAELARRIRLLPGRTLPPEPLATPPAAASPTPAAPNPRPKPAGPLAVGQNPGGLDRASWNRLRGGKMVPARTLDLHGRTAQAAYVALDGFLRAAYADQLRCVEVITGRGSGEAGGVIRRELPLWLNLPSLRPLVLAASHPHPANPGSVRLLLRRKR
jgi:DNA-nicking Smr family endonuclease